MRLLADFLNHGTLPFVGRTTEMERLSAFWEMTPRAHGLRVGLVVGEAGVGKSRLVEELSPIITQDGGIIIHTKLFPGTTTSIAPLIAKSLQINTLARPLLKKEIGETLSSVVPALQRLVRLRPTMLVIEDVHLLPRESLSELSSLLDGMATELFSVLCLARPVTLPARGMLERYLVEEIELEGLTPAELDLAWRDLFGTRSDPATIDILHKATLGNPLALRSTLRAMFKSEAIVHDPLIGWRVTLPQVALKALLRQSVELISEGMAAPLNTLERRAANRLAGLGEVFSQEAALAIVDNAEEIIESLIFKGFLVNTGLLTPPLPNAISRYPLLAFTHTLLHRHFIQTSDAVLSSLVRIVADDYPLYSVLPFQLLAESGCPTSIPLETVRKTIQRSLNVASVLDQSSDWESASSVWKAAATLLECREEEWKGEQHCRLLSTVYAQKLALMRRDGVSEEFETWVGRFVDLTQDPHTDECAVQRLVALNHLITLNYRRGNRTSREIWQEIEEILFRFPRLYFSTEYVNCLQNIANIAVALHDNELIETIEHQLTYILGSDSASQEVRKLARMKIGPLFLTRFSTERELQARLRLLAELEELSYNDNDLLFPNQKFALLGATGRIEEMSEAIQERLPSVTARGLKRTATSWQIMELIHRTAFGSDLEEVEAEIMRLRAGASDHAPQSFDAVIANGLCAAALLRDEIPFCREVIDRYLSDQQRIPLDFRVLLALDVGDQDALREIREHIDCPQALRPLLDLLLHRTAPPDSIQKTIEKLCRRPILRTKDILLVRAGIDLLEALGSNGSSVKELRTEIRDWLIRALTWTSERSLFAFSFPLLHRYGGYLGKTDLNKWTSRVQGIARAYQMRTGTPGSRMEISMLGTITIRKPDEEPNGIRGSRLRLLLGLMVADKMLEHPLLHREFCRLVSSGENDPDYARKIMNGAVWRLRDVLGYEAISTDGETPQLNPEVVTVDLLEAHSLLERVDQILRLGTIMHATPLLLKVLEITNGEVAFPTLYDSFFEAARVDFDCRLRAMVIEIGKRLISEGDTIRAEEMLRRAHATIPGDEEISELLCKTLVMHDKRTEAERVRMQDLQTTP